MSVFDRPLSSEHLFKSGAFLVESKYDPQEKGDHILYAYKKLPSGRLYAARYATGNLVNQAIKMKLRNIYSVARFVATTPPKSITVDSKKAIAMFSGQIEGKKHNFKITMPKLSV